MTEPPAEPNAAIRTASLLKTLRDHYEPPNKMPQGLFIEEIASPDGTRRADALFIPTTVSGRHSETIIGHEIKVSRADLMRELEDPTKMDPWAKYCTRWWLTISDPAIIDRLSLSIPSAWGIMAPPSGRRTRSMTIIREAPLLQPIQDGAIAQRLAAYFMHRMEVRRSDAELKAADLTYENKQLKRTIDQLNPLAPVGQPAPIPASVQRAARIIEQVEAEARNSNNALGQWVSIPDAYIVGAIIDAAGTRLAAQQIRGRLNQISAGIAGIRRAIDRPNEILERLTELAEGLPT